MTAFFDKLPEATQKYLDGRKLDEVECIVADLAGVARGKAMPASKFATQSHFYLPDSIFMQTITGDWADVEGRAFTEPDMVLVPDFSTALAAPWTADWTIQVIHDILDRNGEPISFAPRNVLKAVVEQYAQLGLTPVVAPEMEFFLVAPNTDPTKPIEPPIGRTGRRAMARQAYSMSAIDEHGPVIDDIYDFAEAQGLEIDGILQEGGAGQIEMNLAHGDPIKLADEIFFFKRLIREAALRNGCYATFMAKPIQDEPGSAMHIHHSVIDKRTGKNIFADENGEDSHALLHFISGMQRHLPSVIALMSPYVNSYRRYVPDLAAPINLAWARDNRTTGLRVPVSGPEARRVENRLAGMDCNPYLAIAGSLACGLLGLKEKLYPDDEFSGDAYMDAEAGENDIPRTLGEGLDLFAAARPMQQVLGEEFCNVYRAVKEMEYKEFLQVISPWEREHLLLSV
jgi:glutamine synthetase